MGKLCEWGKVILIDDQGNKTGEGSELDSIRKVVTGNIKMLDILCIGNIFFFELFELSSD